MNTIVRKSKQIFEEDEKFNIYLNILKTLFKGIIDNNEPHIIGCDNLNNSTIILNDIINKQIKVYYNEELGYISIINNQNLFFSTILDEFNYIVENLKQPYVYSEIKNVQDTKPY